MGKQTGAYSELKMAWWALRESYPPKSPKQIHWILSDLCNQDCHFCAYRMEGYTSNELFMEGAKASAYGHDNPVRWIPTERALRMIDEFKSAGVLSLQFTGGGEPTVQPDHEQIFEKALSLGFKCALVSNGYRWRDRIYNSIKDFEWIRVSIDAGNAKSYSEIRRVPLSAWDKAWSNVRKLVEVCKKQDKRPYIGLGFVVTPRSYTEIEEFTRLGLEAGVDNVRFTAFFNVDNEKPLLPIYQETVDILASTKAKYGDKITIYDNFGTRFDDLKQQHPEYSMCPYQYYTTYIGGDLQSYRCCVLAYNKRGLVAGGDLKERRFDEFWNSQERKDDLASLDARGCPRCQFNQKNRDLLYVIGDAKHVEFP